MTDEEILKEMKSEMKQKEIEQTEDGKDVLQINCPTDENIKLIVNGKEITCTS